MERYYFYIAKCADGTLYSGQTHNIEKREWEHNNSGGAHYTSSRRPVKIVYSEEFASRGMAMRREAEVKKFTRKRKMKLISGK